MSHNKQALTLLGGISPSQFLAEFWQKKPLLIRQAIPNFQGLLSANDLAGLACEEDVQSRIVLKEDQVWRLENGPFNDATFANLPDKDWSLLVQSVNHFLPEARALLQQFNFIPQVRLDDLMVSYAPEGGSVGPHFDSYDVFLLQGQGTRLWQVSEQTDLSCIKDAPLRILNHFDIAQSWLLVPGDMLYLPPKLAHWGVAQDSPEGCMTYSIGFRAPKHQELVTEFLNFLHDKLSDSDQVDDSIYTDADLVTQDNSAQISTEMINKVSAHLNKITWNNKDVASFIGQYTTEPNPDIFFDKTPALSQTDFKTSLFNLGLTLDLKTQLLFHASQFFINGEIVNIAAHDAVLIKLLAHARTLSVLDIQHNQASIVHVIHHLHAWYLAGYCHFPTVAST